MTQGVQGDPGQQGNPGIQGDQGLRGDPGVRGDRGRAGSQGASGEQGITGLQGESGLQGHEGHAGERGYSGSQGRSGPQGDRGQRGKAAMPFSRMQALAMFMLITISVSVLTWMGNEQTNRIEAQQSAITLNAEKIRDAAYEGCVSGLTTIKNFNAQQEALADIERRYTVKASPAGKVIGSKRIAAYEAGKIKIREDFECAR